MGKYKIKVKVELVECTEAKKHDPSKQEDGSFTMTISELDAVSIDNCEKAVLRTAYPTIREAISKHLSEISKKIAFERAGSQEVIANSHPYRVDGEAGRFEFTAHSALYKGRIEYNTARDLFTELGSKEFYKTIGFKEIAMIYGDTEQSYRKTTDLINRVRHQEQGGTPYRTLRENTEKEGTELIDFIAKKSKRVLQKHDFTEDGIYQGHNETYTNTEPAILPAEKVAEAAKKIGDNFDITEILNNPVCYEDPEKTVNAAIDDVNVKKQKETREKVKSHEETKRKYVHNTVVHIKKGDQRYTLNGYGIKTVLCFVIAFILNNNLIGNRFQFFTDGHKTLIETIFKCFSWYQNIGMILDWYHLKKKCKEQLSLGMKGRVFRNQVLKQLLPLLWHGLTDKAVVLIKEIPCSQIKDSAATDKLIEYLNRNKPYIPCYAIRKELGLCNSSSIGEKMNDLVVSERQKHNGMSWSLPGSVALASITALKRNGESTRWFEKRGLRFKLAA